MSNEKILQDLLNLTSTIIGLTSIMYGSDFALTITNRHKCLFSKWTEEIDFGYRVGTIVQENYGAYHCMHLKRSVKMKVSLDNIKDAYTVFSQPIMDGAEVVGSLNVITTIENEELLYNIRSTFSMSQKNTKKSNKSFDSSVKLIGNSECTKNLISKIDRIKDVDSTVLIMGESGTGKGVVAKMLHTQSKRSGEPFVHVNCASLPSNLIESELYGYVKGAFTGADTTKKGKFEVAGEGTIFLDEINSLEISLQAKLLSVIQEKTITQIGGNKQIPVKARIIAASNENLEELIRQKRFRKDLFYRLSVIVIHCKPLSERKKDLDQLVAYFIRKLNEKMNNSIEGLTEEVKDIFYSYAWPGNVRELENTLECAIALADSPLIEMDDLPPRFHGTAGMDNVQEEPPSTEKSKLELNEIETIRRALVQNNGHRQKTADYLGITRRSLQYKLKKYDMIDFNFLPKEFGIQYYNENQDS